MLLTNTAGMQGALKNYYQKAREDIVPILTAFWAQIRKIKKGGPRNFRWGGLGYVWNVILGDYVGGNFSDNGWLPDSNYRGRVQATGGVKRFYVRQQFDRLTLAQMASADGSYDTLLEVINEEFQGKMALGIEEGLWGDGRGIKAIVSNVSTPTLVADVKDPYGLANAGQGALWLQIGQRVSIRTSGGAQRATAGIANTTTITGITLQTSPDTYRVTFADAVTGLAATDFIVGATQNDDAWNASPNGMLNITNRAGTFDVLHGVSGASNATPGGSPNGHPRWNCVRINAGNNETARPDQLTDPDLNDICLRVGARSGVIPFQDPKRWLIVTTPGLKMGYKASKVGHMQITQGQLRDLNGGYGYDCDYNGIPIIDDVYCPVGHVFLVDLESLGWADAEDGEWKAVAMDGMDDYRPIANRDGFETSKGMYYNVLASRRSAFGVIYGYSESQRYTPLAA